MYIPRKHAPRVRSTHATMTTKGTKRDILPLACWCSQILLGRLLWRQSSNCVKPQYLTAAPWLLLLELFDVPSYLGIVWGTISPDEKTCCDFRWNTHCVHMHWGAFIRAQFPQYKYNLQTKVRNGCGSTIIDRTYWRSYFFGYCVTHHESCLQNMLWRSVKQPLCAVALKSIH